MSNLCLQPRRKTSLYWLRKGESRTDSLQMVFSESKILVVEKQPARVRILPSEITLSRVHYEPQLEISDIGCLKL